MKRCILLFAVMAGLAIVYNSYVLSDNETRVLRVGVECDHAPYNWEEDNPSDTNFPLKNKPGFYAEGYDVQMAALVAENIGAKVEFIKVSWDMLIKTLQRREIDAIFSGMVDTDERKHLIAFSIPYEVKKVEYAVLINRKSKYIDAKNLNDMAGARMIAQTDSRFDEVIDQIPNVVHLPPLDTQKAIIDEVVNFKADGTVLDYDTGHSYASMYNKNLDVIRFSAGDGFALGFTGLCAGFRKADAKLLKKVNKAIESVPPRERQKIMDKVIFKEWENF